MRVKVTMVCAALAASMALAACGGSDSGDSGTTGQRHVRVAMLLPGLGQGAAQQVKAGIDAQKTKESNAEVVVRAGTGDFGIDQYISNIEDAITQQFDVIAVEPSDPKEIPVFKRAVAAGIKVMFFVADDPTFPQRTTAVFSEQKAAAKLAGEYLARKLPDGGKLGILSCFPGQFPVIEDREHGMREGLASNPKVRIVALLDARCDRNQGRSAMEDMLTAHPDIDAVYSVSDTQTLGALIALDAANRRDVIVASVDAQDELVQKLREGLVGATVSLNFKRGGELAVENAVKIARGERVPKTIDTGATLITNENAATAGQ